MTQILTNEELKQATLAWCNYIRAKRELEPLTELPKGKMVDPKSCPCGEATGLEVHTIVCYNNGDFVEFLPPEVTAFIREFDRGNIPELVENDK